MIQSMTGFGRGAAAAAGAEVTVEVRSVNGRYAEVSVRLPRELLPHETAIQNRARDVLERGKVSVTVQVERRQGQVQVHLDEPVLRALTESLDRLRLLTGLDQPIQISHLLHFKELFCEVESELDAEEVWGPAAAALEAALEDCRGFRCREGQALVEDLRARLDRIERELDAVEEAAPERVAQARESMRERVADLLEGQATLDPERLEVEVALLADRLDVNEECVRLRSHLALFREALHSGGAVGRRLNFLAQEFNREINTIASKANDPAIAHRAITMKEELEKVREQVQNLV